LNCSADDVRLSISPTHETSHTAQPIRIIWFLDNWRISKKKLALVDTAALNRPPLSSLHVDVDPNMAARRAFACLIFDPILLYIVHACRSRRVSNGADSPEDVELLKVMLVEARSLLAELDVKIEQLKARIAKLRRIQFGRKSEHLQRQIATQVEDLAAGRGVVNVQHAQARGANAYISNATTEEAASRQALPEYLPREDHVLKPKTSCPDCGSDQAARG
jgi:hypothetical protein